jgi:hypothetical protein
VGDGAVDALGDPAHPALVHQLDEPRGLQPLDVVVDLLRRVAEVAADLGARARLREPAQDLDAPRLEERVGLFDPVEMEHVLHHAVLFVRKE